MLALDRGHWRVVPDREAFTLAKVGILMNTLGGS
jgi:hypothetical protein